METLLEVRGLKTHFETDRGLFRAVDGISFSVPKGRTIGLVGESGCGKSVTSLSVMGLVPSPPGKVEAEAKRSAEPDRDATVQVVISAGASDVAALIERHRLIDRPFAELQRIDDKTRAELDAHLKTPRVDGKPKPHE